MFNEDCESRNSHRYAVIVQDLAISMVTSVSMLNEDFSGNDEESAKDPRVKIQSQSDSY